MLIETLHDSVAKEKSGEISLIEAENEANNELLARFSTKSSGISAIFTRHPSRVNVSHNLIRTINGGA
ncbi:MAG TPA: hypothetical protein EYG71_02645 [Leucothrix sp.]|nr:hypothetical protein [Leucothrix sp.]